MKYNKFNGFFTLIMMMILWSSCKKDELNPYLKGLPGVYGRGELFGSFINNDDAAARVGLKVKWIDVNRILTIKTYSVNIQYFRAYYDTNSNVQTANLGIKTLKVDLPAKANNEYDSFGITPNQVYELFKTARFKFNQKDSVLVFSQANKGNANTRFDVSDAFKITWSFKDDKGTEYKWWSGSFNENFYDGQKDKAGSSIEANTAVYLSVE